MFKTLAVSAARFAILSTKSASKCLINTIPKPTVSQLLPQSNRSLCSIVTSNLQQKPLLQPLPQISNEITRTLTKYSFRKGKRKSQKKALKRFYRLNWGIWIRTKAGRHRKLWKKSSARKRRLRQHVFCNATQSYMLDKMVGEYWRRPKYYVDDPYEPYHTREEFPITAMKPRPYFPKEEQ
ncbi:unnamed protein product [Acanthoscelides obtectus]|nr:unnamed protein product [Acanthoscelides obtectus]CAK1645217.1 39S ribosomal protein L35, mitochondrial [Acanthoscelides obtectus]